MYVELVYDGPQAKAWLCVCNRHMCSESEPILPFLHPPSRAAFFYPDWYGINPYFTFLLHTVTSIATIFVLTDTIACIFHPSLYASVTRCYFSPLLLGSVSPILLLSTHTRGEMPKRMEEGGGNEEKTSFSSPFEEGNLSSDRGTRSILKVKAPIPDSQPFNKTRERKYLFFQVWL